MQKKILRFLLLFVVILVVFLFLRKFQADTQSVEVVSQEVNYERKLPEDFYAFYNQFHSDSLFQMQHIIFPLKGVAKPSDSTMTAQSVLWQQDDWVLHKPFNDHNGTFERVFTNVEGIVSEHISANNGLFTIEKRYTKLSGEWHLIYYQELIMMG